MGFFCYNKNGCDNMNEKLLTEKVEKSFSGKTKDLLLKQINTFYNTKNVLKNHFKEGDILTLKKGTYLHGIFGELDNFHYTIDNGFISVDFTKESRENKIKNSVGFWKIKEDILLKNYIEQYSGFTISYTIGRGPEAIVKSKMIPYHQFDKYTEELNNREDVWTYWGDKTKEVSFLPSLVSNKRQIAFILNMDSEYAKELTKYDLWQLQEENEALEPFFDSRYFSKFLEERKNPSAATTDRESAIPFGLPSSLIEGVFVGRKIENNKEALEEIKKTLPECYIVNLDGKIIVGN